MVKSRDRKLSGGQTTHKDRNRDYGSESESEEDIKTEKHNIYEDDDEEDEDEEPGVFEVERVVGHKRERGVLSYYLKWKNYDDSDNTWEEEESVFCKDLVSAYWERYENAGGKRSDSKGSDPKPQAAKRGSSVGRSNWTKAGQPTTKRTALSRASEEPLLPNLPSEEQEKSNKLTTASATQRKERDDDNAMQDSVPAKKQKTNVSAKSKEEPEDKIEDDTEAGEHSHEWAPPASWTSWEDHVEHVLTVERSKKKMNVHIRWKNGKETEHPIEAAHKMCPLKLIRFYESHLKFTQSS
ncbi:hypothetical protein BGZ51_001795 [Haplosporangium sp. Z 767]|nr:hypothetical protein BGZ51_001795 [Haplosporangium sp. Z 767]